MFDRAQNERAKLLAALTAQLSVTAVAGIILGVILPEAFPSSEPFFRVSLLLTIVGVAHAMHLKLLRYRMKDLSKMREAVSAGLLSNSFIAQSTAIHLLNLLTTRNFGSGVPGTQRFIHARERWRKWWLCYQEKLSWDASIERFTEPA